jgi:hypothetical protein
MEAIMASPHTGPALSPQLAELRRQFEACSNHARSMFADHTEAALKQRTPKGGWCAAECVEHLRLTTGEYEPIFQDGFARARTGAEPYKKDWKGRFLEWIMEPPYRTGVKTRPAFEPVNLGSPQQVLDAFLESQNVIFARLERANGLALDKTLVESPFKKGFFYNMYSLFHILAAHQRRHLWQAEQALKAGKR